MNPQEASKTCGNCQCRVWSHVSIILIGVAFLLQALNWLSEGVVSYVWPILLIVVGASKLCKCHSCCK